MAYQARKNNNEQIKQPMTKDERNINNNTNTVRNAADVAIATKNPYAMAAGGAVKAADKLTGGKSSEAIGKAINQVTKKMPGGNKLQEGLNKFNESGAGDKIGKAASLSSGISGKTQSNENPQSPGIGQTSQKESAGDNSSKESFGGGDSVTERPHLGLPSKTLGGLGGRRGPSSFFDTDDNEEEDKPKVDILGSFVGKMVVKKLIVATIPITAFLLLFISIISAINGGIGDFDDALGASSIAGGETGDIDFEPSSADAKAFYDRINQVKLEMQSEGKSVDALKIAAVYHILNITDNTYDYDYMNKSRIREIAEAMFSNSMYSEEVFKNNLTDKIFAKYFPKYTQKQRETLTDDVFDYIDRYYSFIGSTGSSCVAAGTCSYNIKGFYIPGKGNVVKNLQINNLKVRLMECGSPYGNGDYNTPIDQELVPFEDYVAGVANAEIGSYAPIEALKAQMVAARSFALARPTAMGKKSGKKLEQENNQWILQISSCVADQVFCDIDQGCSYMGGGDNQGGICRIGHVPGAVRYREPLPNDHQLRAAAAATAGEVLVNSQGYIILTGYVSSTQNLFTKYANQGMNYKQILLQVYNSGSRNSGAAGIEKMLCSNSSTAGCGTASTGPYASWKQFEGPWTGIRMGTSGKTISQIGCLVTSVSMLVAKSGVQTVITDFNPGTFVQFLNQHGGFARGGNFIWSSVSLASPNFVYQGQISVRGYARQQKLNKITELINQGYYVVAEVKGNTGQHWVAIDAVAGNTVIMMDPGSRSTDMWAQYDWRNTSTLAYFKAR